MRKYLAYKTGGAAAVFASALAFGAIAPANAADFGGDCCADLEERVAELEATTARKGNRKVSLTISGHVNEMVFWWDDGFESNVYQTTNTFSTTRFRFKGSASITADVSAGYYIEIQVQGAGSSGANQFNDDGGALQPNLRQSNWWIQSKQLGRLTVGQGSPATDDIILAAVGGTGTAASSDNPTLIGGGFRLRGTNGALSAVTTIGEFAPGLDTARRNIVRYDTPTFGGAKLVAAWGEDDFWDVALWYANTLGDFKAAGGIGYLQDTEGSRGVGSAPAGDRGWDFNEFKGSLSIMHVPSGLFVDGMFVIREFDDNGITGANINPANGLARPDFEYWYVRAGIRANLTPLGPTVFWGDYAEASDGITGLNNEVDAGVFAITASQAEIYGFGINQHISAAAMEIYLGYKHYDLSVSGIVAQGGPVQAAGLEDFDFVYSGARIKF